MPLWNKQADLKRNVVYNLIINISSIPFYDTVKEKTVVKCRFSLSAQQTLGSHWAYSEHFLNFHQRLQKKTLNEKKKKTDEWGTRATTAKNDHGISVWLVSKYFRDLGSGVS